MNRNIFILALLIRLLIAPFFYHPDIKSQYFHFQFLSEGKTNIYQYLEANRNSLPYRDTFNYLPLTYFTFGSYYSIVKNILPDDFTIWVNDWGPDHEKYINLPIYLLILKLPYILFDLGIGLLIYKLFGHKLSKFWLFNPIVLYLCYILGNFDVLPSFLSLLAFYFLTRNNFFLLYLSLGFATALKFYPLMLVPFFFFYKIPKFKHLLLFFVPLLLSIIPVSESSAFISAFTGSGLTQKAIELKLLQIPVFPLIYFTIFVYYILKPRQRFFKSIFLLFVVFISTVHFHPQWIIWFLPLIFPYIYKNLSSLFVSTVLFLLIFFYIFLFDDRYLFWNHFLPISNDFSLLNHPYNIIRYRLQIDPAPIQTIVQRTFIIPSLILLSLKNGKKSI